MALNIAQLKSIFEHKKEIFRALKKYVKPVEEFARDAGLAELKQEEVHLFLGTHFFRRDTGLLPIIDSLIEINNLVLSYEEPRHVREDELVIQHYRRMIELIRQEQHFLINYFKKTLDDVIEYKGYHEYWTSSFANYKKLLDILRLDLTYFSVVLQTQAKNTIYWLINLIHQDQINEAIDFLENPDNSKSLSEDEVTFFQKLLTALKEKGFEEANQVLEKEGKDLLEDDEYRLLSHVLLTKIEKQFSISPSELAISLAREAEQWNLFKKQLPKISPELSIPLIEAMPQKVGEALEAVKEVAPEVERIQEVKILEKLPKLRVRINLLRRKKLGYKNRKETLIKGLKVLKESINLRKRIKNSLKSLRIKQAINRLGKEYDSLSDLYMGIENKKRKFTNFAAQLTQLQIEVDRMHSDIGNAIAIIHNPNELQATAEQWQIFSHFPDLWTKLVRQEIDTFAFVSQLLSSVAQRREQIDNFVKNIGRRGISRRQLVIGLGAAAGLAAAGGTAALLARKKQEIKIGVKIIKPSSGSSYTIGKNIDSLDAEAEGPKSDLINAGQAMKFIWGIRQDNSNWINIHEEKSGSSNSPIPRNFTLGTAQLAVFIYDNTKLIAQSVIDIELSDIIFDPLTIPEVNKIIYTEGSYKNATYIVVIPHSTELNALDAARAVAKGPITYVAGNNDRNLKIKTNGGIIPIDPNNAFCTPGLIRCFENLNNKKWDSLKKETQSYIVGVIAKFTNEISRRIFVGKMVLALHQNTKGGFGIRSYKREPKFSRYAAEVFINPAEDNDVFAYVNTRGLFEALKSKGWNVVLQKNDNNIDDGSISYATTWRGLPYVNIEVKIGDAAKQTQMIKTLNELLEQYPQLAKDMDFVPPQVVSEEKAPITSIAGNLNILIIGSDMMQGREKMGERGDSLVVINTDTNQKVIRILTIPRDTYVSVRGRKTKINHALAWGGWRLQKATVEELLSIRMNKVFLLDINNLRDIFYLVRRDIGNYIVVDIFKKVGISHTVGKGWESVRDFVTNRKFADAAVGRAKRHAKSLAAGIELIREYYNNPDKRKIFEESFIGRLLGCVKHTDLTPKEVISIINEWSTNDYKIELYFIPGKAQNINKVSYWVAENIPGGGNYFTKVINYRRSRVA